MHFEIHVMQNQFVANVNTEQQKPYDANSKTADRITRHNTISHSLSDFIAFSQLPRTELYFQSQKHVVR